MTVNVKGTVLKKGKTRITIRLFRVSPKHWVLTKKTEQDSNVAVVSSGKITEEQFAQSQYTEAIRSAAIAMGSGFAVSNAVRDDSAIEEVKA